MTRESIEELRERLLRDEQVRQMISMRAYEIYQIRGARPGHEAEDWFQAENEILTFLIDEESRRYAESVKQQSNASQPEPQEAIEQPTIEERSEPLAISPGVEPEISKRASGQPAQVAEEKAQSQSRLGVWSATQPESEQRAPVPGASAESQDEAPKKSSARATTKSSTAAPRKRKAAGEQSATQKTATKKTATENATAKQTAAKKTAAKRASAKKSTEGAKTRRTKKQTTESKTQQ